MTALMLGLRASAVVMRTVEDLDDDGWLLWVRNNKTAAGDLEIEIPPVLRERLLKLADGKKPGERLFGDVSRHWLHYHTVRLCDAAKFPRITPHGLRGSGATMAVRLGGSVASVARALGHADDGDTLKAHYLGGGAIESARARSIEAMILGTKRDRIVPQGRLGDELIVEPKTKQATFRSLASCARGDSNPIDTMKNDDESRGLAVVSTG